MTLCYTIVHFTTFKQCIFVQEVLPVTNKIKMDLFNSLKIYKVSKGTILLKQGETCRCAYKVISGCLKSFVVDKFDKEHIIQFAPENWIITDIDSLLNQKPSDTFIEVIEECEVIKLNLDIFRKIESTDVKMLKEQNAKILKSLIASNKRLIGLLALTAKERYLLFIETYPTLAQRVPLKQIASYIGVTPQYLSEIRREIAKK